MIVGTIIIKIHLPWVHSLKEKRMVVKSICSKVGNKFNVSIAEVDEQDIHQLAVIGIACVTSDLAHVDSTMDHILNFVEGSTEGEIINIEREIM